MGVAERQSLPVADDAGLELIDARIVDFAGRVEPLEQVDGVDRAWAVPMPISTILRAFLRRSSR